MSFWPFQRRDAQDSSTSKTMSRVISCWPSKMRQQEAAQAHQLRIATSSSFSINALVELLRVGGGRGASQPARVRAAVFAPGAATTLQFHVGPSQKPGTCARASCVHALRLLTPEQTTAVLDDVKRIGESIGWSDRGVSLPTQDVLVQKLSKESQDLVHRAIRAQHGQSAPVGSAGESLPCLLSGYAWHSSGWLSAPRGRETGPLGTQLLPRVFELLAASLKPPVSPPLTTFRRANPTLRAAALRAPQRCLRQAAISAPR